MMNFNINRNIKVVKVSNNDIENLIEFEKSWFIEGDVLQNIEDEEKDIELIKEINKRTFTYRGNANKDEIYYIKRKNYEQ